MTGSVKSGSQQNVISKVSAVLAKHQDSDDDAPAVTDSVCNL
jgi:hypothetical protein